MRLCEEARRVGPRKDEAVRRAARLDSNHNEIVAALRDIGATVTSLAAVGCGVPDLLCGYGFKNFLLEIKSEKGKLDEFQKVYHRMWKGQIVVVRTVDEALRAIVAIR